MNDILKFIAPHLTFFGSIASIVGLLISVYLFFAIRAIKRNYLFRARIPALQKKLKKHASNISSALQQYDETQDEILSELSLAEVNLISLKSKTNGTLKASLSKTVKELQSFRKKGISKDKIRSIYLSINMRIQEIENYREDEKWEGYDG